MIGKRAGLLALLALLLGTPAAAAPPEPLFAGREPVRLSLKAPGGAFQQGSAGQEPEVAGTLTVTGAVPETLAVVLSPRGITRRRRDVCTFPPLRVEFPEKPAATSLFKGQKNLKLVTHCRSGAGFQQHLLLEYAAYRMYNTLTPVSFNVRLAQIDYVDATGRPLASRLGFFIEDVDETAKRNGMRRLRTTARLSASQLSPRDAARFAVFQNLIGNLDWSMLAGPPGDGCCHNSRLIGPEGASSGLIPTPYDFDFSGLVDAPYATPPEGIQLPNVRARRYRGYCLHKAEAKAVAADLLARRASLVAVLDGVPQLEERTRRKAAAYLDGYFTQLAADPEMTQILRTCVG